MIMLAIYFIAFCVVTSQLFGLVAIAICWAAERLAEVFCASH
jgi:hypothetical protein